MNAPDLSILQGYLQILTASHDDQRALFEESALRHQVDVRNVEKDFWVHLVLGLLFVVRDDGVGMNFKGGTSLSLGYGLINRFSEDIDITIDRVDLVDAPTDEDMKEAREASTSRQSRKADEISKACGTFISGPLKTFLDNCVKVIAESSGIAGVDVVVDPAEKFGQTLLFSYPTLFSSGTLNVPWNSEAVVRIEAGARGAMEPLKTIQTAPMAADGMPGPRSLDVTGIPTISPVRTFCDKLTAVHGFKCIHGERDEKAPADRLSRHYYDLHMLWRDDAFRTEFLENLHVIEQTREHKLLLFYRKKERLEGFDPANLDIVPEGQFKEMLAKDYKAMSGMIRGEAPAFDSIMASLGDIEKELRLLGPDLARKEPPGWPDEFSDRDGLTFNSGASREFAR